MECRFGERYRPGKKMLGRFSPAALVSHAWGSNPIGLFVARLAVFAVQDSPNPHFSPPPQPTQLASLRAYRDSVCLRTFAIAHHLYDIEEYLPPAIISLTVTVTAGCRLGTQQPELDPTRPNPQSPTASGG